MSVRLLHKPDWLTQCRCGDWFPAADGHRAACPGCGRAAEITDIEPGTPLLLWATNARTGEEYWQAGLVAATAAILDVEHGEEIVYVAWQIERNDAQREGRPVRAEPWPTRLIAIDPRGA